MIPNTRFPSGTWVCPICQLTITEAEFKPSTQYIIQDRLNAIEIEIDLLKQVNNAFLDKINQLETTLDLLLKKLGV